MFLGSLTLFPVLCFISIRIVTCYFIQSRHFRGLSVRNGMDDVTYFGLHHCGLIVEDVQLALPFYTEILGLIDITNSMRPKNLNYPGAFLKCGNQQIHLMQLPDPDKNSQRPSYVGRDKHVAIAVSSINGIQKRLTERQVSYNLSSSGRKALFCRDLDGNGFEFVEIAKEFLDE